MKTAKSKETLQISRSFTRTGRRFSIDRVLDHFQGALCCIDQFGLCAGLTMGVLMGMTFLLQAAHSGAEKGVI